MATLIGWLLSVGDGVGRRCVDPRAPTTERNMAVAMKESEGHRGQSHMHAIESWAVLDIHDGYIACPKCRTFIPDDEGELEHHMACCGGGA